MSLIRPRRRRLRRERLGSRLQPKLSLRFSGLLAIARELSIHTYLLEKCLQFE